MSKNRDPVCLVIGAGDATGGAIAKRFARENFTVVPVRRNAHKLASLEEEILQSGGRAIPMGCDARKEDQVVELFNRVEKEIGPIECCVFNIGANVRIPFAEIEVRKFYKIWEMACFAGFLTCREATKRMAPRGYGCILATGASASIKGYPNGAAFASAKFALRGMLQGLAREYSPLGLHICHFVIDGAIDTQFIQDNWPEAYKKKEINGILNPDDIAENYWQIFNQPKSAWTHEMDLRPWIEKF